MKSLPFLKNKMKDEDLKEIISNAKQKGERKFIQKVKKRIEELTMKKNNVAVNSKSRQRYNFAIGELMFLIQE